MLSLKSYKFLFEIAKGYNDNLKDEIEDKKNSIYILRDEVKTLNLENQQLATELHLIKLENERLKEREKELGFTKRIMKILRHDVLKACKTSGPRAFSKFDAYMRAEGYEN